MRKGLLLLTILALLLFTTACSISVESPPAEQEPPAETQPLEEPPDVEAPEPNEIQPEPSDLTLQFPEGPVTLLAYEDEMDLAAIFGPPLVDETIVLENADTFTGSFRKTLVYPETTLTLFSPKDDGERFYVYSLESSDERLTTYRGLRVGDSLEALRQAYPEMTRSLDGTTGDDGRYEVWLPDTAYTTLFFFVEDGQIHRIQLLHEFP